MVRTLQSASGSARRYAMKMLSLPIEELLTLAVRPLGVSLTTSTLSLTCSLGSYNTLAATQSQLLTAILLVPLTTT